MRIRLVRVTTRRGARAERVSIVVADVVTVGRGSDNLLQLSSLDVSLHHATLGVRSDGVFVQPVGRNWIKVNGRTSAKGQSLRAGDEIQFGAFRVRIRA